LPVDPQGFAGCGNPGSGALYQSCYPPAVNYTPFYFLINGQAFDRTNPARSLFAATAGTSTSTPIAGNLLVRLVNAGLRMHVPAIVGSLTTGFSGSGNSATGVDSPLSRKTVIPFSTCAALPSPLPLSKPKYSWPPERHMTC
jgi:hypothetical protein